MDTRRGDMMEKRTYTVVESPSGMERLTYTNRQTAERDAQAIAQDFGATLSGVRVYARRTGQQDELVYWLRRSSETGLWYKAETGQSG